LISNSDEPAVAVALDDPQRQPYPPQGGRDQGRRASGLVGLDGVDHDGALFLGAQAEDRVAVKPHASPVFHAMQYLMGNQTREKMENFRGLGGVQSYPSRTKDIDDVDFSTGSVGLGVGITSFASLVQDYIKAKEWGGDLPLGRMVALVGDAELDEGNIYETLQEGWKNDLRNCWWIIDYNRQSLDGIVREGCSSASRRSSRRSAGTWCRQVRRAAARGLRRAGRRQAARVDRQLPQPALLGAHLHGRGRVAQAPDGRPWRPGGRDRADRAALR
jgi:transketolase N-terminal domain/subunit